MMATSSRGETEVRCQIDVEVFPGLGGGGDSGVRGLKHIDYVVGCEHAFAARLRDGNVLTWGSPGLTCCLCPSVW